MLESNASSQLPRISLQQLLSFQPCYTEGRLRDLAAGRTECDAIYILDLNIPPEDRLAAVLRPELLPPDVLLDASCDIAYSSLSYHAEIDNDEILQLTLELKKSWLKDNHSDDRLHELRKAVLAESRRLHHLGGPLNLASSRVFYAVFKATELTRDPIQLASLTIRASHAAASAAKLAIGTNDAHHNCLLDHVKLIRMRLNKFMNLVH